MNPTKNIYLMAGGRGAKSTNKVMKAIFKELDQPNPSIAYVGAANGDDKNFFRFIGDMIQKGGDCTMTQVFLSGKKADVNQARDILHKSDAIFMSGGDVEAGMQVILEKRLDGFFKELYKSGKLFFGASAGSIMLANEWVRWRDPEDDASAELFPCLGIAPVLCDTHAEDDNWEELQWALKIEKPGITGFGIASSSCLKISANGRIEALGGEVSRFIREGDQIKSLTSLAPLKFGRV